MSRIKMKFRLIISLIVGMMILTACENPITIETDVHDDGTLDKSITFEDCDSSIVIANIFGVGPQSKWSQSMTELPSEIKTVDSVTQVRPDKKKKGRDTVEKKFSVTFKKHFNSVEEANADLNTGNEVLFNIKSTFDKKFRWFYTYITYTETYMPLNRFKMIDPSDYINEEDHRFISRLPGEGHAISKADSLYLQMLHVKIDETYANQAIFNEEFDILLKLVKENGIGDNWLDSVRSSKDYIFSRIDDMRGEIDLALEIADSLGIPLKREKAVEDAARLSKDFNNRLSFMTFAKDGRYKSIVNMPWEVTSSNADSVSGSKLFWRPLPTKFLFTEYTMFAESRRLNTWTVVVSVGILLLTVFALWRRSKR